MNQYNEYLQSETWRNKKTQQILVQGLFCKKCGCEIQRANSELHHKNYDKEFGYEDEEDLMLVCKDCHKELHQDIEFFDNEEMKNKCPECNRDLINNKCKFCGVEVIRV